MFFAKHETLRLTRLTDALLGPAACVVAEMKSINIFAIERVTARTD
jgi:hypothetical protein